MKKRERETSFLIEEGKKDNEFLFGTDFMTKNAGHAGEEGRRDFPLFHSFWGDVSSKNGTLSG